MKNSQNILVIGASGGSGRKTIEALVNQGHHVTAFSRKASEIFDKPINIVDGSVLDKQLLEQAIAGQDAVIIILGISENPLRTRLLGPKNTQMNIRSHGTRLVVETMKKLGVKRLVVQTTFGSGPSKDKLKLVDRLFFNFVLKPQIEDTELQDNIVRHSGLNWTITQPVHLCDDDHNQRECFSSDNNIVKEWQVSRKLVGECNAMLALDDDSIGKTIAVSSIAV